MDTIDEREKQYTRAELEQILNPWQIRFVELYCWDWNKTKAYLKSKAEGGKLLTDDGALKGANAQLAKSEIKQYIEIIKNDVAGQAGVSKQMMINELRKIAQSNIAHLHDTWIARKDFEQLHEDDKAAIQEISTKTINTIDHLEQPIQVEYVKVKLYDKRAASNDIIRAMGWSAADKIDVTITEKRVGRVTLRTATQEQKGL
jgi:phage terminase small subunit